jgi:hypothetical protein
MELREGEREAGKMALTPCRGDWDYRLLDSNSTATFVRGSAVGLLPNRTVGEYTSVMSQLLGIALNSSVDSAMYGGGKVLVAIPNGANCTVMVPMATNLARSALSIGTPVGVVKSGNTVDLLNEAPQASAFSRIGSIYGPPILSPFSQIEVALNNTAGTFFSSSTHTFAS